MDLWIDKLMERWMDGLIDCWMDEWIDLSMAEVKALEEKATDELNTMRRNDEKRGTNEN